MRGHCGPVTVTEDRRRLTQPTGRTLDGAFISATGLCRNGIHQGAQALLITVDLVRPRQTVPKEIHTESPGGEVHADAHPIAMGLGKGGKADAVSEWQR